MRAPSQRSCRSTTFHSSRKSRRRTLRRRRKGGRELPQQAGAVVGDVPERLVLLSLALCAAVRGE